MSTLDVHLAYERMRLLQVVASALITYDVLLTLPWEIALVWRGNWALPAVLYTLNRYGVLAHSYAVMLLTPRMQALASVSDSADNSLQVFCNFWQYIGGWSVPLVTLLAEALLTMRVIAFYGRKIAPAIVLWAVYAFCGSMSVGLMIIAIRPAAQFGGDYTCPVASNSTTGWDETLDIAGNVKTVSLESTWGFWAPGMFMELVLILCTLARCLQFWVRRVRSNLVKVITEDNLLYFLGVFGMMAVNLGLCAIPSLFPYFGVMMELTLCLNSILASRIFLRLRATAYPEKIEREEHGQGLAGPSAFASRVPAGASSAATV
ncbi:hypothetical protein CALCODRAFT_310221 [Calocera cornea HHB12733]|uniref:DUF6533 domain-containing protein n=1 Tax=Calocera cornea HHB12733 TaxID=1353952 RepID=A0A165FEN3_9BASI|nr:hypothetical protein CALCODRAFT_310221 [Calocera cornea HHB12733]